MAEMRFYDGLTPIPYRAQCGFGHDALLIKDKESHRTLAQWPFTAIELLETPSIGYEYVLSAKTMPDARLMFTDRELYERIFSHGNAKIPHGIFFDLSYTRLAFFTVLAACCAVMLYLILPSLSRATASLIPESLERHLGKTVEQQLSGQFPPCKSKEANAILSLMAAELQGEAGAPIPEIVLLKSPIANAFAVPGRRILILSGLLKEAKSSNEVAGVLAHEMGHATLGHPLQGMVQELGIRAFFTLAFHDMGGDYMTEASQAAMSTSYTRTMERDADREAIAALKRKGLPLASFADFFERAKKDDIAALQFVSTHPMSEERIEEIRRAQEGYTPTMQTLISDQEWQTLKTACD